MASRKPAKFAKTPSTILSDSINRLTLKEPAGKEATFEDETHVVRNSAAENYFMQGKSSQMNAARRGRKKLGRVESSSDEDEDTKKKKTDDPTKQFSLQKLSSFVEKTSKEKLKKVKEFKKSFDYWTEVYLASEFNICLIGAGSKNAVLNLYHQHLTDAEETTFIVDGFKEEASVRAILQVLFDELKLKKETGKDTASWARQITEYLSHRKEKIYMLLHNIDSTNFRDPADQRALATLSSTPWLRLITSLDHLKTTMMWDSKLALLFNFVFVEASTFDFSLENLVASKSTALGLNPKNKSSSHTMASLDVLWQSLAENAKKIFAIFFGMTFASGQGVPFWDLFNAARDDFLVSSDAALRQLLVEFEDHRILNRRRREDGNENLLSCIERQLVEAFLAEKNITLEI